MDRVASPAERRPLLVVSNREPYVHSRRVDGSIAAVPSTGGVAVALDALMRERGGTWIAHGSGDADRLVVDERDRVRVPPDAQTYTLRRIWLSPDEERRYYNGFANEGLWPLCHIAHVRPIFRSDDWAEYRAVNARFADAIADELPSHSSPVFIQDYHLALTAGFLRRRCPDTPTALFWHIPWPDPDRLRMCPWRREIVRGLLANDLLAFQLERDRRNFLMSVRDELSARVESRQSSDFPIPPSEVTLNDHTTQVVSAPIGVDFDRIQAAANDPTLKRETTRLVRELRLDEPGLEVVGIGVDRLDYTKGIPERSGGDRSAPDHASRICAASLPSCRLGCRPDRRSIRTPRSNVKSTPRSSRSTHGTASPPSSGRSDIVSLRSASGSSWPSIGSPTSASSARSTTG